jgi:hypothetical protein
MNKTFKKLITSFAVICLSAVLFACAGTTIPTLPAIQQADAESLELPAREKYIEALDVIGKWYASSIATYQNFLEEESVADYLTWLDKQTAYEKSKDVYIEKKVLSTKKVFLKYFESESKKEYNVITDKDTGINLGTLPKDSTILKASHEAVENYINQYKNIKFRESISYYPCPYIEDSVDDYRQAGDECVRFFFTIMNSINKSFTYYLKDFSGHRWSRINTTILATDETSVMTALYKLGFDIYDSKGFYLDTNEDGILNYEAKKITRDFKLKTGDAIIRDGHIHIYMGADADPTKNFGWGKVNRKFPNSYTFGTMPYSEDEFAIYCSADTEDDGAFRPYTRVLRYNDKE